MLNFKKQDAYGQELKPGDVCAYSNKGKVELVLYKKRSHGGKGSKSEFGRFITTEGKRSLKYTSVVFAFDPMGKRRNQSTIIKELSRQFYEGAKK